jgi:hypothetical protein
MTDRGMTEIEMIDIETIVIETMIGTKGRTLRSMEVAQAGTTKEEPSSEQSIKATTATKAEKTKVTGTDTWRGKGSNINKKKTIFGMNEGKESGRCYCKARKSISETEEEI